MLDLLRGALRSTRRLREPLVRMILSYRGVACTVNGIPLRIEPGGRALFTEIYDPGASAYLREQLRDGMEVWNVGANVGVYTLQLAHLVGRTGRVVAFEPNPATRAVLSRNVARNAMQSRVEIIPWAVGATVGTVDFFAAGIDGRSRPGSPNPEISESVRIEVPITTLDAFAAARGRTPALVMMDIEGWEVAALQGARSLLGSACFVVEFHPNAWEWSGHSRADLEALLASAQLTARPVSGQGDPLAEYGQVVLEPRPRVSW